jgi:Protein of unknown function (DUF3551)
MKILVFLGVLFAGGMALQTTASAQGKVYEYCLESPDGGGGSTINCDYESLAQCMASKGSPGERCYPNPRLGGRR